jgi:hypothetical protein
MADLVALAHLLYVLFALGGQAMILLGGLLRWKWVRNMGFRMTHLTAVAIVALEAVLGMACPLTVWEYDLRQGAGENVDAGVSFIARLVRLVLYYDFPAWVFTVLHISFGVFVLATIFLIPPRRRQKT